jgi:uncharacterized protein (DUF2252 family)
MRDPLDEFRSFNRSFARLNPELLRYKIKRMAESPFAFFRGSFHLFARDVGDGVGDPLPLFTGAGVEMDLVGDIHSENFGTYKAEDGLVHYDINDFDETTTGRFDFDICRLTTSHFLAARDLQEPLDRAVAIALGSVSSYTTTLRKLLGKSKSSEPSASEESPTGAIAIDDLMRTVAQMKRAKFFKEITEIKDGKKRLIRSDRYFTLSAEESERAHQLVTDYRRQHPELPSKEGFFDVLDVCGRVSGIGSMGRLRYVVLLEGKGSKDDRNLLLEFKEARPSAYDTKRDRDTHLIALADRAKRVIEVQRASQVASNRFLGFAVDQGLSFQVRELGPHNESPKPKALKGGGLASVARVQAELLARVHARAASRAVGPTNPLAELTDPEAFCQRVLAFALGYADVVQHDFIRFLGARADLDRVEQWMANPA